jgi:hypothetical protein
LRIAAAVETQPQRLAAGVAHLQCRQPIAVEVAGLRFVAGQRLRLQRGLRLPAARQVGQRTSGKEQGVGFLGRQPALAVGLFRQRAQQLILRIRQQLVLFQQRQLQGVIAQRATVIAQPAILILTRVATASFSAASPRGASPMVFSAMPSCSSGKPDRAWS